MKANSAFLHHARWALTPGLQPAGGTRLEADLEPRTAAGAAVNPSRSAAMDPRESLGRSAGFQPVVTRCVLDYASVGWWLTNTKRWLSQHSTGRPYRCW